MRFIVPALALALATVPSPARAGDEGPLRLSATVGTQFPVDVGGRLTLEGPGRLQLSTSLGFLPGAYVDALNSALVEFQAYPQTTADLIAAGLSNSLVWRTQAGWRPFADWGFYFQLGYTLTSLGGSLTGVEALAAATGKPPPAEAAGRIVEVQAESTVHMLGGELGYRWLVLGRVPVQLALGGFGTVAASTTMKGRNAPPLVARAIEPYLQDGARFLDDTYTSYVHGGYLSLQVGFQIL